MRDVLIIAKCDRCHTKLEDISDEPLDKWVIDGITYRPELCGTCTDWVGDQFNWLTPVRSRKKKEEQPVRVPGKRTSGKFAQVPTPCAACGKTFKSAAGLSQHLGQVRKYEGPDGIHGGNGRSEVKDGASNTSRLDCRWCGKTFKTPSGRAGHEVSGHRAEWKKMKEAKDGI